MTTEARSGRMLLSHNFDLSDEGIPPLNREEFVAVFQAGLQSLPHVYCRSVDHPHWIVEVVFPIPELSPTELGFHIAQALVEKRQKQSGNILLQNILILGGVKTTPATGHSPEALQPGEWGVDVVETLSAQDFLDRIHWQQAIAERSPETVFKVEWTAPTK